MSYEIITVLGNVALVLSVIVALIFGIAQVKDAARNRKERLTIEVLHDYQTREFAEMFNYIYVFEDSFPHTAGELSKLPNDQRTIFIQLLQQMEVLGILVAEGLVDIDLVDKILGSFVTTAWKRYKDIILIMRNDDPFTGEYFQALAREIHKRLTNNPRKPFNEINSIKN